MRKLQIIQISEQECYTYVELLYITHASIKEVTLSRGSYIKLVTGASLKRFHRQSHLRLANDASLP